MLLLLLLNAHHVTSVPVTGVAALTIASECRRGGRRASASVRRCQRHSADHASAAQRAVRLDMPNADYR